jgi:hypothetical protein
MLELVTLSVFDQSLQQELNVEEGVCDLGKHGTQLYG